MNAFSEDLHDQFVELWAHVERDEEARAVVLTGAGKAFSAGGSYDDFEHRRVDMAVRRRSLRLARRLVDEMLNVAVPVVAAVNGPAVWLGCTVTTLCDIVFMADTAFPADTHVSVALAAGDGWGGDMAGYDEPAAGQAVSAHWRSRSGRGRGGSRPRELRRAG